MMTFALAAYCLLDPWWQFKLVGRQAGLSQSDIAYYIRINRQAGWKTPEEKF